MAEELFGIVKSHHFLHGFCSEFINQSIKRCEAFSGKTSFLCFAIAFCNGFFDKGFLFINGSLISNQLVNGNSLDSTKNLLQARNKTVILNI